MEQKKKKKDGKEEKFNITKREAEKENTKEKEIKKKIIIGG